MVLDDSKATKVANLKRAIKGDYRHNWIIDNLPAASLVDTRDVSTKKHERHPFIHLASKYSRFVYTCVCKIFSAVVLVREASTSPVDCECSWCSRAALPTVGGRKCARRVYPEDNRDCFVVPNLANMDLALHVHRQSRIYVAESKPCNRACVMCFVPYTSTNG